METSIPGREKLLDKVVIFLRICLMVLKWNAIIVSG
jgi:hypothetical protein